MFINEIENRILQLVKEGADIIDIGAMSSRPGAQLISENEEKSRLIPVLELIKSKFKDIIISVDTVRAKIADEVIKKYNVSIINDISAGEIDSEMFNVIENYNTAYVIMHMKGLPENMQIDTNYKDVLNDIIKYFVEKVYNLSKKKINDIIIDPGFGFGKSIDQNYYLLKKLDNFKVFGLPLLAGISRKSMIYKFLNISPQEALNGTLILNFLSLQNGANILRVHDVKEAKETINLFNKINDVQIK